jgi:hypothetical protein
MTTAMMLMTIVQATVVPPSGERRLFQCMSAATSGIESPYTVCHWGAVLLLLLDYCTVHYHRVMTSFA